MVNLLLWQQDAESCASSQQRTVLSPLRCLWRLHPPQEKSVRQPCYSSACSRGKARCSLQEAQNASSPGHGPLVWVFPCFFLVCGGDSELSENLKYTFLRCLCLSTNYPRGHFMSAVRITSKSRESSWEPGLQRSPSNRQLKVFCTVKLPLPLAGDRVWGSTVAEQPHLSIICGC